MTPTDTAIHALRSMIAVGDIPSPVSKYVQTLIEGYQALKEEKEYILTLQLTEMESEYQKAKQRMEAQRKRLESRR